MSKKQLLLESCDFSFACNLSEEEKHTLTESLRISAGKNGNLIVKSIPCTILDRRNANGRIYPTALMQKAIDEAKPKMKAKMLLCSYSEHPQNSFPEPKDVSHCVINAYIKNVEIEVEGKKERHNVLFNDWEILNEKSQAGAQAQQLLLSGFGVGTSIRSLGSCDPDGTVTELEFLGTDLVGQPSSSTFVNSVIGESVSVSAAPLTETFVVSASATNVVRDLDQALVLANDIENAEFGTVKKTSTKLDSEVDPKTGAETTMVTLETETEDEVSDIDQALAMAKQAMLNGRADIDSVTIENVKEEQPKESAEKSDAPVLNEDDDEDDDDTEHYEVCGWCGEKLPLSDLKKERDFGYLCNHCARGLQSREGPLNFEDEYVPESVMDEAGVDKLMDEIRSIMYNEGLSLEQACHKYCEYHENIPYEYVLEYMRTNPTVDVQGESITEATITEAKARENNNFHMSVDFARLKFLPEMMNTYPENHPFHIEAKKLLKAIQSSIEEHQDFNLEELEPLLVACDNLLDKYQSDYSDPKIIKEAKEDKQEDPNKGKQFVLKTNQGFVAMDGNAIKFVDKPHDAIHFVKGKEESGVIHLSGINKILDTMGIYDVEKYYKKGTTDISAKDDVNIQVANATEEKPVKECGNNTPMTEDNGSNTRYSAHVSIMTDSGTTEEDIPVSAVEMEGINKEVGNLYDMKAQKGEPQITVTDTATGEQLMFNPETHMVEPMEIHQESAGELKQDGNKVSMEIDDNNTVEKEFENPAQASVVKAGLEQGKLGGDVLISEDNDRPHYEDVKPGWYAGAEGVGVTGPYESKEALLADLGDVADKIDIEYISAEDLGVAAESTKIDEVMFNEPGEASDPEIKKPMNDAVEQDIMVSVDNIDWDNDDLVNNFMGNMQPDDPVSFGDIESKINDLPNHIDIKMSKEELPEDVTLDSLKELVKEKIAKTYAMNVNDLAITELNSIN